MRRGERRAASNAQAPAGFWSAVAVRPASWIKELLAVPDILATPQERILHLILRTLLLVAVLVVPLLGMMFPAMLPRTFILLASLLLGSPFLMWLSKQGHTRWASWGLVGSLFLLQACLLPGAGGTSAPGMMTFLTLILISGVLLGKGAGLAVFLACTLFVLGIAFLERAGWFANAPLIHTPFTRWGVFMLQASIILGLQRLFSREVAQAMGVLVEGRTELERRVAERTHELAGALGNLSILNEELREAQILAEKARRGKDTFLSIVSHELRSPLTSLRGSLSLLRSGLAGQVPPDGQAMLDIAERNTQRLLTLVNELLDHQRVEAGVFQIHPVPLDLREILHRAAEGVQGSVASAGAHLDYHESSEPLGVEGDPERLEQVLVNLLSNALAHGGGDKRVDLQGRIAGDWVRVEVGNSGDPIPDVFRERIFLPFEQGDIGRVGSGLGLYLSKAITEAHQGRIGFSCDPGRTVFFLELPRTRERA